MSERETIHAVFLDDEADTEAVTLFGQSCKDDTEVYSDNDVRLLVRAEADPDYVFEQMTAGEWSAQVLILDVNFSGHSGTMLRLADHCSSSKNEWGLDILGTLKRIDPDFPIVMLTSLPGQATSFEAGRFGADEFMSKGQLRADNREARQISLRTLAERIRRAIRRCNERPVYDHAHLATADAFAKDYDGDERNCLATVAYYHYENDLIISTIDRLLSEVDNNRRVRILDVGCGTGRIEELLLRHPQRGRLEVIALDFSRKMISKARAKLEHLPLCSLHIGYHDNVNDHDSLSVSLFRASAERINFAANLFPDGFDFVILGFGFLSYVRYNAVVVPIGQESESSGVVPLIREGGHLLFSVYNENSAIYDRIAKLNYPDSELPIAAIMDPVSGFLQVADPPRFFACEAFTIPRIQRFLRQGGLIVDPEAVSTFPTLHLMLQQSDRENIPKDPELPPGHFSPDFYRMDVDLSHSIPSRGHYIVGVANKGRRKESN